MNSLSFAFTAFAFATVSSLSIGRCQEADALQFLQATKLEVVEALEKDEFANATNSTLQVNDLRAIDKPLAYAAGLTGLLQVETVASNYATNWEQPYSREGIAHVLLCPHLFAVRWRDPQPTPSLARTQNVIAKTLVKRLESDEGFRDSYRKFLVWSSLAYVPPGIDYPDTPYESLIMNIQSSGELSYESRPWRKVLRIASLALLFRYDEMFSSSLHPRKIDEQYDKLLYYIRVHNFIPSPDGFGWNAESPADGTTLAISDFDGASGRALFRTEAFDRAVRALLLANAGEQALAVKLIDW